MPYLRTQTKPSGITRISDMDTRVTLIKERQSTIRADAEVAQLRETPRLVAVAPDFSDIKTPVQMLDPETAGRALHIGKRQAEREATAIRTAWDGSTIA
jgi:hypothetical protein